MCLTSRVLNTVGVCQVKGAAFVGPSLLEGQFNEDDSSASFADALKAWRGNGRCAAVAESPATGTGLGTLALQQMSTHAIKNCTCS